MWFDGAVVISAGLVYLFLAYIPVECNHATVSQTYGAVLNIKRAYRLYLYTSKSL